MIFISISHINLWDIQRAEIHLFVPCTVWLSWCTAFLCTCVQSTWTENIQGEFWYFADRASQYIYLNINQLDALNFYNEFISCLYMFRARVLIVRRPKLYYTVSGIWWYQRLYSTILASWRWALVLETCRGMK